VERKDSDDCVSACSRVVVLGLGTRTRVPFFGDSDSDSLVGDSDLEVQDSDSPLWYSIRGFSVCCRVGVADRDLSLSNRRYRY